MNHGHELLHQPIPGLIRKLAIPTSVGYFFNTMFNVVDTFYGGRVSTEALAALSLSFPIFFLIIAIGAGISTGATALIGHELGAGNAEEARHLAGQTISFGIVHGFLVAAVGFSAAPLLFQLLGAKGPVLQFALQYMDTIFTGSIFFLINYVLNSILNATGDSRSFRNFLVVGFFLNMIFDPWFLYGGLGVPALGLSGIAWATVLVQGMGNIYLAMRVRQSGMLEGFRWRELVPRRHPYSQLARQGFPSSLNMMTVASGIFLITWFVGRFGSEAVAAYGIGARIEQIALLPVMGMNVATLALVAQNSGARQLERVVQTIKTALRVGVAFMGAGTVVVYLAARPLMGLFSNDPKVVEIGVGYLRIEAFVFVAYVILYTCVAVLQGLKRPGFALMVGLMRQIVFPLPVFYLLAVFLGFGLAGIWWGILLVTWGAACVTVLYVLRLAAGMSPAEPRLDRAAD
ncbi:MatE-like domain efflux pump [Citrifermentans bemidjiense Bem]|uniref:MatE-like domain efflux pump n=1 Tax=Citrifermentans bemidjiense (strain ATCC BAA-1014 / DSM 16622 / JCM 12645 / Bem) TaxID=404380 RepID=B5EFI5_CITBB|nr:MATE family efflux transporter [Citrifermentans bemidjiense]ACH40940.1 MatE-like domain efflux pump [Citrifermentans bemidjiense Bem]